MHTQKRLVKPLAKLIKKKDKIGNSEQKYKMPQTSRIF